MENMFRNEKKLDVTYYQCVENYGSLGDGRNKRKILVGDRKDARIARFLFLSNLEHNWPSHQQLRFANKKVFDTASGTLYGRRVYIFRVNFFTRYLWKRQCEINRMEEWARSKGNESQKFTVAQWIVEATLSRYKLGPITQSENEIVKRLPLLSLEQLRLFATICVG